MSMLPAEDHKLIVEKLGREPNTLEQGCFLNLWSEHCSYRSSGVLLRNFKTDGKNVIIGPGDDAAVIKFDDEYVLSVAMESHNHPSYVEPYSGAATGVGGIVRDVISMGTRAVAVLAPFYVGPLDAEKNRWLFDNILQGSADYSKTIQVAAIRGESYFDERYNGNPLVNVVCVGLGKKEHVMTSISKAAGNRIFLFGSKTGKDGLGGASFASNAMGEDEEVPEKSAIPAGDAELERRLIDATIEIIEKGLVESCRDLGAAGLAGAASELADKGNFGAHVLLDAVPVKYEKMTAYEVMLAETQERMLAEIKPENLSKVMEIMKKHNVPAADIGYLTKEQEYVVEYQGKVEAKLPIRFLIQGVPKVEMPSKAPAPRTKDLVTQKPKSPETAAEVKKSVLKMLSSYNLASRKCVWEKYKETTLPTVVGESGGDAGIMKVTDKKGVAMTCGCEPAIGLLDPYAGAVITVIENAMNVAVKGAAGLCLVDNLNFGNPKKPDQYWILKQSVLGLADAAKKLNIPVVGGNVSLYNESDEFDTAILPTPSIGILGIVSFEKPIPTSFFKNEDETVILVGTTKVEMGGSEYYRVSGMETAGIVPSVPADYDKIVEKVVEVCASGNVTTAHDISKGGLGIALAKMVTAIGADVDLSKISGMSDEVLFAESPARVILTTKSPEKVMEMLKGIPAIEIGKTKKASELNMKLAAGSVVLTKEEIDEASSSIEKAMKLGYKNQTY
ncbi:phosphoribosylformylglycinamidine synthase subunit PurL [Methanolapillus millepedarum]|uniref:Phosphoribosylformylglycinamidine synthase subunit PurL n=1 Tax=Methanolapillus millepedarum TaxID=3028296 RepID=A0AA97A2X9_9EURY|nr:Phosphoribosylformylglycinamidine synthase subunit PurL [Methanosarcinaceae archaeon Ac7]